MRNVAATRARARVFVDQSGWPNYRSRSDTTIVSHASALRVVRVDLWGRPATVYVNANFSIYSAQRCNAARGFCVKELRPASRAGDALRPLSPTISITGGEPSKDARLERILHIVAAPWAPRKTLTTNGPGWFDRRNGVPGRAQSPQHQRGASRHGCGPVIYWRDSADSTICTVFLGG